MKKEKFVVFLFVSFIMLAALTSAITASIGNSRMILRVEPNEEIERYILVKNTNTESVIIELFPTGDLQDSIELVDTNFTLLSGEEKKAYFTITPSEEGTTTSNINVRFTPSSGGDGVGLTSTVIVIAGDGTANSNNNNRDDDDDDDDNDNTNRNNDNNNGNNDDPVISELNESENRDGVSLRLSNLFRGGDGEGSSGQNSIIMLGLIVVVLLVLLLVLLLRKPKRKKDVHGQ